MTSEDQIKAVLAKHIKPWEMDGFPCVTGIPEAAAEIAALASTAGAGAGDPPQDDSPLIGVYSAGIGYAIDMLAKITNAGEYVCADGSETFEGDVRGTILNVLRAAKLYDDEDGQFASLSTARAGAGGIVSPTLPDGWTWVRGSDGDMRVQAPPGFVAEPHAVPASPRSGAGEDSALLDMIASHGLAVIPQANGGWVIEGDDGSGEQEVEIVRTRERLRPALREAARTLGWDLPDSPTAPAEHGVEIRAISSAQLRELSALADWLERDSSENDAENVRAAVSALSQADAAGRSERAVEIRELSEKAYPGPWTDGDDGICGADHHHAQPWSGGDIICDAPAEGLDSRRHWPANRAFIIALESAYRSGELVHRSEIAGRSEKGEGEGSGFSTAEIVRRTRCMADETRDAVVWRDCCDLILERLGEDVSPAPAQSPSTSDAEG